MKKTKQIGGLILKRRQISDNSMAEKVQTSRFSSQVSDSTDACSTTAADTVVREYSTDAMEDGSKIILFVRHTTRTKRMLASDPEIVRSNGVVSEAHAVESTTTSCNNNEQTPPPLYCHGIPSRKICKGHDEILPSLDDTCSMLSSDFFVERSSTRNNLDSCDSSSSLFTTANSDLTTTAVLVPNQRHFYKPPSYANKHQKTATHFKKSPKSCQRKHQSTV